MGEHFLNLSKKFSIIFLEKGRGPSFQHDWLSFTKGRFMLSWVESGSAVLEKIGFFKSSVYFHYFDPSYSPCKRAIKSSPVEIGPVAL